jgi:hypothetical protein
MAQKNFPNEKKRLPISSVLGLLLFLSGPSTRLIYQNLGSLGLTFYLSMSTVLIILSLMVVSKGWHLENGSEAKANLYAILTIALLMTLFFFVYPIANTHEPGKGSDRDDGLNLAVTELLHGRYPYDRPSYLGNPISPLPGAIILALPFVVMGNSAYQNFFWLVVFFFLAGAYLKNKWLSLLLLWFIFLGSPIVLHEIVTGGDLLANSLYVAAIVIVFADSFYRMTNSAKLGFSIFAGVALSSRAHVLLIVPMILSLLYQRLGFKGAVKYGGTTILAFLAVTVPFWLYSPARFSPFHTYGKLLQIDLWLPGTRIGLIVATLILSCVFSIYRMTPDALLNRCALVFYVTVGASVLMDSLAHGYLRLELFPYGLIGLFLGALSIWVSLFKRDVLLPRGTTPV